ncbi:coil containing protein [Vibrio phage 1.152.O._10N.222.46.E1]|uniref:Coil containing protein n=6 Tax=Pontosvirinae TaxID=2842421 RepID=A0A2I7RBC4_9CAUD|nr:DksA-like zinc-finger protein [Vibrio phage 1.026.O._10N.222.49.C7]YP_009880022.1 DksA-like zinc-finger protein [Vibrio phage 1.097.O._10N.286.49.B3]AUR82514.1 coil containing protein [Vibrio phage 1.025.O._10N.222.46.B6]AUR90764.1 coil containing protein [Vibrio phage 1.150.O._10N.222.46.A6]AUR90937.1 coil containing protein [Vibrio phage 1.152.O._10N.222.46.E1]AUS02405.1 coil containing protein [Vibrio phage 2.130.O._10N.222.46.C2]AUR82622.1 coil containing protein [Vibrio phage 1.026.O.
MNDSDLEKAEQIQLEKLKISIEAARKDLSKSQRSTGYCLNCAEQLPEGGRFCDKDCAEDYEKYPPVNS